MNKKIEKLKDGLSKVVTSTMTCDPRGIAVRDELISEYKAQGYPEKCIQTAFVCEPHGLDEGKYTIKVYVRETFTGTEKMDIIQSFDGSYHHCISCNESFAVNRMLHFVAETEAKIEELRRAQEIKAKNKEILSLYAQGRLYYRAGNGEFAKI